MQLTPEQLKKLDKLGKLSDPVSANIVLLDSIDEVNTKVEEISNQISDKLDLIQENISNIEIPEQKDHTEHMKMMMDKIEEPQEITVTLNII